MKKTPFIKYLDSLSDRDLALYFILRFQSKETIWEECTEEEYKANVHAPDVPERVTDEWLSQAILDITAPVSYRKIPLFNDGLQGLFAQIAIDRKPCGFRYEKSVGERMVIILGGEMMNYLNGRAKSQGIKADEFLARFGCEV